MSYQRFKIADESLTNDSSAKSGIPFPRERAADDLQWFLTNMTGKDNGTEAKEIWIYDVPMGDVPKLAAVFENFRCYVSIEDHPRILSPKRGIDPKSSSILSLMKWIVLNKEALLKHWNSEIDICEFFTLMQPLSGVTDEK